MAPSLLEHWIDNQFQQRGFTCLTRRAFSDTLFVPLRGIASPLDDPLFSLIEIFVDPTIPRTCLSAFLLAVCPDDVPAVHSALAHLRGEYPEVAFDVADGLVGAETSIELTYFAVLHPGDIAELVVERFIAFCDAIQHAHAYLSRPAPRQHHTSRVVHQAAQVAHQAWDGNQ
ncbi:MAG: hypothetical protein NVSMB27_26970 [Ktedonobacteraceae bacterium]